MFEQEQKPTSQVDLDKLRDEFMKDVRYGRLLKTSAGTFVKKPATETVTEPKVKRGDFTVQEWKRQQQKIYDQKRYEKKFEGLTLDERVAARKAKTEGSKHEVKRYDQMGSIIASVHELYLNSKA